MNEPQAPGSKRTRSRRRIACQRYWGSEDAAMALVDKPKHAINPEDQADIADAIVHTKSDKAT